MKQEQDNVQLAQKTQRKQIDRKKSKVISTIYNILDKANNVTSKAGDLVNKAVNKFQGGHLKTMVNVDSNDYNPDKIPASKQLAEMHMKANIVGQEAALEEGIDPTYCPCCARQVEREEMPLDCELTELAFLGCGIPLYFDMIRYCICLLITYLLSSGLYNIITNSLGDDCIELDPNQIVIENQKDICSLNWITRYSLGNKKSNRQLMIGQNVINLFTIIILITIMHIMRRSMRQMIQDCDTADISPADYTIMVKNLPTNFEPKNGDYDDDIKEFFSKKIFPNKKLKVVCVNVCYDIQEKVKLQNLKAKIIIEKQKQLDHFHKNGEYQLGVNMRVFEEKLKELDDKIKKFEKMFEDGKYSQIKQYLTGQAFITYNTEQEKEMVLDKYHFTFQNFLMKTKYPLVYQDQMVSVEQAPDPSNVFWENLAYGSKDKIQRRGFGFIITAGTLIGCLFLIFSLKQIQKVAISSVEKGEDSSSIKFLAVLISLITTGLNFFLILVIRKVANVEVYSTRTEYTVKVAKSLSIAQFSNSALICFLIEVVFTTTNKFEAIFTTGGLVYNQIYVFISNALVPLAINLIDPLTVLQKQKIAQILKLEDKNVMTQRELNEVYQRPVIDIGDKYAFLIQTVLFCGFYSVILPLGVVFSIFGLMLIYFADKLLILKKRSIKYNIGEKLPESLMQFIEFIIPINSISQLIFFIYLTNESSPAPVIFSIIIGVIYVMLPNHQINKKIFRIKDSEPNKITYLQALPNFETDYARENPATQGLAKKEYIEQLLHKKQNDKDKNNNQNISNEEIDKSPIMDTEENFNIKEKVNVNNQQINFEQKKQFKDTSIQVTINNNCKDASINDISINCNIDNPKLKKNSISNIIQQQINQPKGEDLHTVRNQLCDSNEDLLSANNDLLNVKKQNQKQKASEVVITTNRQSMIEDEKDQIINVGFSNVFQSSQTNFIKDQKKNQSEMDLQGIQLNSYYNDQLKNKKQQSDIDQIIKDVKDKDSFNVIIPNQQQNGQKQDQFTPKNKNLNEIQQPQQNVEILQKQAQTQDKEISQEQIKQQVNISNQDLYQIEQLLDQVDKKQIPPNNDLLNNDNNNPQANIQKNVQGDEENKQKDKQNQQDQQSSKINKKNTLKKMGSQNNIDLIKPQQLANQDYSDNEGAKKNQKNKQVVDKETLIKQSKEFKAIPQKKKGQIIQQDDQPDEKKQEMIDNQKLLQDQQIIKNNDQTNLLKEQQQLDDNLLQKNQDNLIIKDNQQQLQQEQSSNQKQQQANQNQEKLDQSNQQQEEKHQDNAVVNKINNQDIQQTNHQKEEEHKMNNDDIEQQKQSFKHNDDEQAVNNDQKIAVPEGLMISKQYAANNNEDFQKSKQNISNDFDEPDDMDNNNNKNE